MINKLIPIWIRSKSQQTIWIATPFLIALCWLHPQMLDEFFQANAQLTTPLLGKVAISLFLISLALLASTLLLLRKPSIKDYDLVNPPGFLKHKTTGKYYCQRCLLKDHIASELSSVVTEKHLVCHCCDKAYNISANLITDSYLSKTYDEAMKEIHLKDKDG